MAESRALEWPQLDNGQARKIIMAKSRDAKKEVKKPAASKDAKKPSSKK